MSGDVSFGGRKSRGHGFRGIGRGFSPGFSLVELLVVIALMGIFSVIFFGVFHFNVDVSRVQEQIAEMQQNLRIAKHQISRMTRMAGRGGLPATRSDRSLPAGVGIEVRNNVPVGATIGDPGTPAVLEGTDVLIVRGVFSSSIYQVVARPEDFGAGKLRISSWAHKSVEQDLASLAEAVESVASAGGGGGVSEEALVVLSPMGQYTVLALEGGTPQGDSGAWTGITLNVREDPRYLTLVEGGATPSDMTAASMAGILEEYRYYVRAAPAVPGDPQARVSPRLSRARFYPGTNIIHPSNPSAAEDIADQIVDLQLALGIDRSAGVDAGSGLPLPGDGAIVEWTEDGGAAPEDDEWLFNHPDDDAAASGDLQLLRITLMSRTARPDRKWSEMPLVRIEDHSYDGPGALVHPVAIDRLRRRRVGQAVLDLRNL